MHCTCVLSICVFVFCSASASSVLNRQEWSQKVDLEEESGIKFRWRNTQPDSDGQRWLVMEVSARATGYVGVGFSPNGAMEGADIAIAWINFDGNPQLKDFHGLENGPPIEDPKQDYQLLHLETRNGWTTLTLKRRWDTCDEHDFLITEDTMRLIWAYSNAKPQIRNGKFTASHHGPITRGAKSVIIADGASYPPFPDDAPELYPGVKIWDVTVDKLPITVKDTYYYCSVTKFTDIAKKHHMIGWRPLIQKENRDIVHHIVVFECTVPDDEVELFDQHHKNNTGGTCYTPNMPAEWGRNCVAFNLAWVLGSEGDLFPEHVGAPLGQEHGGTTYFMLEYHYENLQHRITTDSSGIRFFYTDKLRKYDGGTMLIGYRHSPFLLIPPRQDNFMIHGLCTSECTSKAIPPSGIHLTNTLVHMHLVGEKTRLRHFRDGVELPIITEDNHYDFNYQQSRNLKDELTILPGDELIAECEYKTKDVSEYVIGGLATNQEMCQIFFFYYPRVNLSQCTSQYEFHDFFNGLGIEGVEGRVLKAMSMPYEPHLLPAKDWEKDVGDDARELEAIEAGISFLGVFNFMNITKPDTYRGKTVGSRLKEIDWTEERGKTLERGWKNGKHYQFCSKPGLKRVVLDKHIIDYPNIKKPLKKERAEVCIREEYYLKKAVSGGSSVTLSSSIVALMLTLFLRYVLRRFN